MYSNGFPKVCTLSESRIHPPYNLYIEDEAIVFAEPEFVIDNNKISVIYDEVCGLYYFDCLQDHNSDDSNYLLYLL